MPQKGVLQMKIITGMDDCRFNIKTAVTVGKFDGLHMGHEKLLEKVVGLKKFGYDSTVITFDK